MKNIHSLFFLLLLSIFLSCSPSEDQPIQLTLSQNWEFSEQDSQTWNKASVPGNVFTDLMVLDKIPDPFTKANEAAVQWVATKDWQYKTQFTLPDSLLAKEHIELNFAGVDTYAKLYLNDSLLGQTSNAFRSYSFAIKTLAKKENELRVEFSSPQKVDDIKAAKNPYQLP